jgi:site-specific recombinase XerD
MTAIAATVQRFFTDRLIAQRQASGHTITAYRDAIRLLLTFAADAHHKSAAMLDFADLDAPTICAFLDHLRTERGNSTRTRNNRLATIHSLFGYAALHHPEHAADIARVLAIQPGREHHNDITWLTDIELTALLNATDHDTWTGRRDHALLTLDAQTGLRASELLALTSIDLHLGAGAHVSCHGKGRKDRITPLTPTTVTVLRAWTGEHPGRASDPLFTTRSGNPLSRDALAARITLYSRRAANTCPSLAAKNVTPHVLRHTAAMRLLHAGVEATVIALWLGHETVATTNIYLHADMELKQKAIDRTTPIGTEPGRYQPPDTLLAFLQSL